jgi:hypothetical protein
MHDKNGKFTLDVLTFPIPANSRRHGESQLEFGNDFTKTIRRRDGNLHPTREYQLCPVPNGVGFTQSAVIIGWG